MYATLKIEMDSSEIGFQQSSNLHGALMEQLESAYVEELHLSQLHPYSQYAVKENGKSYWYIKTVNERAYEKIIVPLSRMEEVYLKKKNLKISLRSKEITTKNEQDLMDEFYQKKCSRYLDVQFINPTAFKREGRYVFYPEPGLVYGSLMRKYSQASEQLEMFDQETWTELSEHSEIIRYRLQTIPFPVEKVNITGFIGTIRIHIKGPETMARYARMLFQFGEYAGVGIKTALGMGAFRYIGGRGDD